MSKSKVVVTGATGFLGWALAQSLVEDPSTASIICTGRNKAKGDAALSSLLSSLPPSHPTTISFVYADLADADDMVESSLWDVLGEADVVYHAAALSSPWGKRADFVAANVDATANVLAAMESGASSSSRTCPARMVYISTPSIYASSSPLLGIREDPERERDMSSDRTFVNAYAETKAAGEGLVYAAVDRGLVEAVVLRPRALFGPGDTTLLPRIVRAAQTNRLRVIGSDRVLQDLTYIDNAVHAARLAACADAATVNGKAYNITNDEPVRVWDMLTLLMQGLHLPTPKTPAIPVFLAAWIASLIERIFSLLAWGEPPLTVYGVYAVGLSMTFDITNARNDLGYRPLVSISTGIQNTIEAHALPSRHATPWHATPFTPPFTRSRL